MTKIRQEAAGSGTGTIALRAPVTNETRNLEYPDRSGTFALIDGATGAPAMADGVPVVESGSNSDGIWTKWGDGTQQTAAITPTLTCNQGPAESTGLHHSAGQNVTLPSVFVGIPRTTFGTLNPTGYYIWAATESSTTSTTVQSLKLISPLLGATGRVSCITFGRWK